MPADARYLSNHRIPSGSASSHASIFVVLSHQVLPAIKLSTGSFHKIHQIGRSIQISMDKSVVMDTRFQDQYDVHSFHGNQAGQTERD